MLIAVRGAEQVELRPDDWCILDVGDDKDDWVFAVANQTLSRETFSWRKSMESHLSWP
jgi:hypothetical protein